MLHWSIKYSVHRLYFCVSFHAHSCVHFLVWCPMAVGTLKKVFQSNELRALKLHARTYLQWAGFPRNHLTGCEHSHQYIMCSLLPDPKLFPCISAYSLLLFHCTFAPPPPFFFSFPKTMHRRGTIVASFISFRFNHSKSKIWGDRYGKYVFNLIWWIIMSEDFSSLPRKKFLLQNFFLFMRDINYIYFSL